MPYRANEPRRHKIPRARYRVTNWPEYDRALQRRGSLTVWVTPEALAARPPVRGAAAGARASAAAARRSPVLSLAAALAQAQRTGPVHVVIDATGLKVHGTGEWLVETHGGGGERAGG